MNFARRAESETTQPPSIAGCRLMTIPYLLDNGRFMTVLFTDEGRVLRLCPVDSGADSTIRLRQGQYSAVCRERHVSSSLLRSRHAAAAYFRSFINPSRARA